MIVEPWRIAPEVLDHLDLVAEMLCECWPLAARDDDVRPAAEALVDVVVALLGGDRGAALLAAETIHRRAGERHVPLTALAWRGEPWPDDAA